MTDIKRGDVVALKSGSPDLTVDTIRPNSDIVEVAWFEGATLHRDTFPVESLRPITRLASGALVEQAGEYRKIAILRKLAGRTDEAVARWLSSLTRGG